MYHFGEKDPHIPPSDVEKIRAADPNGMFHLYPADHGFNCEERGSYDAASAQLARERTLQFLAGANGKQMIKLKDSSLWKELGFIAGKWAAGGFRPNHRDPQSRQRRIAGHACRTWAAAETRRAIEAAHAAMPAWSKKTAGERAKIMRRWFDLMLANVDDLAVIMTAEQGKPLAESKGEIAYAASFIEWFAEEGKRIYGDIIPGHQADKRIMVLRQPIGVVAAITPWNFPAAMITRKAGAGARRGLSRSSCKPAPQTPYSALAMAELAQRAGIPAGRVQRGHRRCGGHRRRVHRQRQGAQAVVHRLDARWQTTHVAVRGHGEEGGARARRQRAVPGARRRRPRRRRDRRHPEQVPQHRPDLRVRQSLHRAVEGLRRFHTETHRGGSQAARGRRIEGRNRSGPADRRQGAGQGRESRRRCEGEGRDSDHRRQAPCARRHFLRAHGAHRTCRAR